MGTNINTDKESVAKRSNRSWSDCDERELIKLKSLGSLTWNKVGECLQRTGAACQLHWKTMKKPTIKIKEHIQHIKNNKNTLKNDYDFNLLINIDKILKANQWKVTMLDVLWSNVEKEAERENMAMATNSNHNDANIQRLQTQHIETEHIEQNKKRDKKKKKKKHKKKKNKKHHHHHHHLKHIKNTKNKKKKKKGKGKKKKKKKKKKS